MLGKYISFKNFKSKNNDFNKKKITKIFKNLLKQDGQILNSFTTKYKDSYSKKLILKLKKKNTVILIGMGGSILGARAIHNFLIPKVKKFFFIDSFQKKLNLSNKRLNIIVSKSGNTLETISNTNILINKNQMNLFITENKNSYLLNLAKKLKSDVVHHNNFIGGRYSVLSEVGMLPAELMGFKPNKFRRLNHLVKNKYFVNNLVANVSSTLGLIKKKKLNSIILNYDEKSTDLFNWYQQLLAESLGKKGMGLLPFISSMPRDNHSLMQYYLEGTKNNFFTFFFVRDASSNKIINKSLLKSHNYLKNKTLNNVSYSQFVATTKVFQKKNIPFRSFLINKRNEETLGELFTFFVLETILLGKMMNVNPYNQPAVELIKSETKKTLKIF